LSGRNIFGDSGGIWLKLDGNYSYYSFENVQTTTGTSHKGTETGKDDIPSRTREETEGHYEMIFAMTNELKNMNRRQDKDREAFKTFRKEYEINREEREGSDDTSFRENICSLVQQLTKLERDLHDI